MAWLPKRTFPQIVLPMTKQIRQVAITYVTRPTLVEWIAYGLFGAIYLVFCYALLSSNVSHFLVMVFPILGVMAPGSLFANQLHWQFRHPRSRLIPGFRAPHVIIWASLMLLITMPLPLAALSGSTVSVWPVLCGAAVGAAASQSTFLANGLWMVAFVAWIGGDRVLDDQAVQAWMTAEGYRPPVLAITTLLAWATALWQVMRIGALPQDDPGYSEPIVTDPSANVSRTFRLAREKATARSKERFWTSSESVSRWLDRQIRRVPKLRPWRRINIAFFERQSALAYLGSTLFVPFIWGVVMFRDWDWDADRLGSFWFLTAIATAMAAFVPAAKLTARIPQMTSERLLPMSNQAYADALVGVCLWHTVRSWLILHAVMAVVAFALPWEGLDPPSPGNVAAYLAISLAGLTYCFGVGMFCSPMQGCFPLLFAGGTGALATLALQGYWTSLRPHDSQGVALFWAVVLYAAGLGFLGRARQLWRHKELGRSLADHAA